MRQYFLLFFLLIHTLGSQAQTIIPLPQSITYQNPLSYTSFYIPLVKGLDFESEYLSARLKLQSFQTDHKKGTKIQLQLKQPLSNIDKDAYEIIFNKDITITASNATGIFYGIQSLLQIIGTNHASFQTNIATIKDQPSFQWRGMHLDVCRHFFPVSFIKKYIDLLAMHKMNTFHWHLTDDQGWRIEIKKYPRLTEIGSKRPESILAKNFNPYVGDGVPVEGFYTQEEIKDVVKYAAQRHITIVPEIEMPGHAVAAIAAYPYLGCTGQPTEVLKIWGVSEDVFCTKESNFQFVFDVLTEVMNLFPSPYIHIGGDEVPKTNWKKCAHCQGMIRQLGLKNEEQLQSYFIQRVDSFIVSKKRNIIGWDEILEGGLAKNAAVMSWRGEEGGTEAAQLKHPVVMCPVSHCYFDYYQGNKKSEPLAIGGYTPLKKTYNYHPVPKHLPKEYHAFILGAQGNIWTEYISTPEHVLYMALPRLCALSEVVWTKKELRNYDDFIARLMPHFNLLKQQQYNYANSIYDVAATPNIVNNQLQIALSNDLPNTTIRYSTVNTLSPAKSMVYTQPIAVNNTTTLSAALFKNDEQLGNKWSQTFTLNKATAQPISLLNLPDAPYQTGGANTLIDGVTGSLPWTGNEWLGWHSKSMVATISLNSNTTIEKISISLLHEPPSWIHLPKQITIAASDDNKIFKEVAVITQEEIAQQWQQQKLITLPLKLKSKYLRITALPIDKIPQGENGAGEAAWLFCSEILID